VAALAPDAAGVISADAESAFAALARRLLTKASTLAAARAEDLALGAEDPRRWRQPRLLWPLFIKG